MTGLADWVPWENYPNLMIDPEHLKGYIKVKRKIDDEIRDLPWMKGRGTIQRPEATYEKGFVGADPYNVWNYIEEQKDTIEKLAGPGHWLYPDAALPAIYVTKKKIFFLTPHILGPNLFGVVGMLGESFRPKRIMIDRKVKG